MKTTTRILRLFQPSGILPFSLQAFRLSAFLLAAFSLQAFSLSLPAQSKLIISADFEKGMPAGIRTQRCNATIDTTRAHSGNSSVRLNAEPKNTTGNFSFDLDGKLDFNANTVFSMWIYAEPGTDALAQITASDGSVRYVMAASTPNDKPGQWTKVTGFVPAGDWRKWDTGYVLNVRINGEGTVWVDDILMATTTVQTPAQVWPKLKQTLHATAAKRASPLAPGDTLTLDARHAAVVPDTARDNVILPPVPNPAQIPNLVVPADGLLVFAIDAKTDLDLTGTLHLEHTSDDLRPGARVTVLANDTVIGAPSIKSTKPWTAWANNRHSPIPNTARGERPPPAVPLAPFRLAKGRHHIIIAGNHNRHGGTFSKLELRAAARPAEKPIMTFGVFSDTHIGNGRDIWMGMGLHARCADELEAALRQLKSEGGSFAIIAGDATNNGRRSQIEPLAAAIKRAGLPVHGVYGNHDVYQPTSRADFTSMIPGYFPPGPNNGDYTFTRGPLRFIILDGTHIIGKRHEYRDGMLDWLRDILAKDTTTPTIVCSHYHFYNKGGVSATTGYQLGRSSKDEKLLAALYPAPNVIATFSGHTHQTDLTTHNGITSMTNPSIANWPNAYRVCRVYPDRIEWEIRQISNRGLIREGVVKETGVLTALHADHDDLSGTISLAPRNPSHPATP